MKGCCDDESKQYKYTRMCVFAVGMKPDEEEPTRRKMSDSNPMLTGNATDTLVQIQAFKAMSDRTTEFLKSFTSGAIAGAVAKTTIAPLDRTKIIFQSKFNLHSCMASRKIAVIC